MTLLCHRRLALCATSLWHAQRRARLALAHGDRLAFDEARRQIAAIADAAEPDSALARAADGALASLDAAATAATLRAFGCASARVERDGPTDVISFHP